MAPAYLSWDAICRHFIAYILNRQYCFSTYPNSSVFESEIRTHAEEDAKELAFRIELQMLAQQAQ